MNRVVIGKFNLWQGKVPLFRLVSTCTSDHVAQHFISNFGLAISLGMGGATSVKRSPEQSPQSNPEVSKELGVSVGGGDGLRYSMQANHLPKEQPCNVGSVRCLSTWYEVYQF